MKITSLLLLLVLTACSGANKEVSVEKPVDEFYNKGMDELTEGSYARVYRARS